MIETLSTRRSLLKVGAALAAPLTVATVAAAGVRVDDSDALKARLAQLDDRNAIRDLCEAWVRHINARDSGAAARLFADPAAARHDGSIRSLASDPREPDVVEVAADRTRATVTKYCIADTEVPIEPSCPLVEMARQQGEGVVRRSEQRVLKVACVRLDGAWKIERAA